jgi:hypothetical protein
MNNDYMYSAVDRIISQLYESGIAKIIIEKEAAVKYLENISGPFKLSMRHLGFWFLVLLSLLSVALVAFVIEFLVHKIRPSRVLL